MDPRVVFFFLFVVSGLLACTSFNQLIGLNQPTSLPLVLPAGPLENPSGPVEVNPTQQQVTGQQTQIAMQQTFVAAQQTQVAVEGTPTAQAWSTAPPMLPVLPTVPPRPTATSRPPTVPPPPLAPTYHDIVNLHTQKCITAPTDPLANNVPVLQATCVGAPNQMWKFVWTGDGYYEVVVQLNGRCLDVENSQTNDGLDLVESNCAGKPSQRWRLAPAGSYDNIVAHSQAASHRAAPIAKGSYYQLVGQHGAKCAEVADWSHDEGAHIIQYSCASTNNDNQLWALP